jgi:TPR repeat protein
VQAVQPEPAPTPAAVDTTPPASAVQQDAPTPAEQPARSPKKVKARVVAPAADDAEIQGENYLYGNGVQQNCTRARQILLAAAQHSNSRAQNVLATMYATGHCATRDLPTTYKWFSRSLRKDPSNTRIEQDLKVLWNQMTAEERNRALQSE